MIQQLTDEELLFLEDLYNPVCLAECLFSDYDNLIVMEDVKLAHIRTGQIPLLSHEYQIDMQPDLSEKQNFQLRKGASDVYALGGRLFGKTLVVEKIDFLISVILLGAEKCGFASYDQIHIRGVLEEIINVLDHHPLMRIFEPQVQRAPSYRFYFKTGYLLESINMNITGKKPGAQFFQKHLTRLYIEEASFETEHVYQQRRDSISENGCVFRIAGMTNFTKYSPCGRIFYDMSQKGKIVNLPQYVNPKWDEKTKQQAIKDFGGEQSAGYRVFIKGEIVEDGVSVFDMERVRRCYDEKRTTKVFEITKKNFDDYEYYVILERPSNAEEVYIFADIGESAPTEIGIIFKIGNKYRYEYNITLYGLTDKEQYKFFRWIAERLDASYIAIDCTDGTGRSIYRSLAEVFPLENLVWVAFNEKIPVGFEKHELTGDILMKDGKPIYKEEYVTDWSVKHLKDLLYSDLMDLPIDYKFDQQINSVVSMQSGTRTTYDCVSQHDHMFQAFQVFSIAHWLTEFLGNKSLGKKTFCKTAVG
jgi:hypothetical protein